MQFYVGTRRVVGSAIAYAVLVVIATGFFAALDALPQSLRVVGSLVLGLVSLGVLLGIVITVAYWIWAAVKEARGHGAPPVGHLGFWGIGVFLVLFVAAYVTPGGVWAMAAVRVLGSVFLAAGVLHTAAWLRRRTDPDRPYAADRYSLVTGGDPSAPLAAQPTADDWNASLWDPDVLEDIERRRNRNDR